MGSFAVIAGGKAATVFEPVKGAFNPVPLLVERPVIGPGYAATSPRRDHWRSPLALNVLNECLTIIAFVSNDVAGAEAAEQRPGLRTIVALPRSDQKADGAPVAIHGQMNLGGQSTSGTPHSRVPVPPFPVTACWCARTIVLSSMR